MNTLIAVGLILVACGLGTMFALAILMVGTIREDDE